MDRFFGFHIMDNIVYRKTFDTRERIVKMSNQTEANKRWQKKNKTRAKYLSDRSRTRSFIRNLATLDDIEELRGLLDEREDKLKEGS